MTELDDSARVPVLMEIAFQGRTENVGPVRRDFAEIVKEALDEEPPSDYIASVIRGVD